ncbi:hypothetical protein BJ165DRAFT_1469293 [Panaeolus papilionaceus]|nr:hypothetical protein BJ165DRAFT_1469293 [Panaeolus papilionaceus]
MSNDGAIQMITVDDNGLFQSPSGGSSKCPSLTPTSPSKSQETPNSTNTDIVTQDGDLQSKYNTLQKSYNNVKMALIIVTALFGVFAIVFFTLIILLGGLRVFAKSKDPEEPDKAKEQAVPVHVKEDSPSSKDAERSLSLQPGLDHPAG